MRMRTSWIKSMLALGIVLIFSAVNLTAQSLNEAGELFNKGIQLTSAEDYEGAIAAYEQCISMCDKLGDEGDDLKARAFAILPDLHYRAGLALYRNKKVAESIPRLEKAAAVAKEYGDNATEAKINKLIPQLYYAVGSASYKKDEFEKALVDLNKAIALDPEYSKPYLIIALSYSKLDRLEEMREALDKAIQLGTQEGDEKSVNTARDAGYKTFLNRGQRAIQSSKFAEAEGHLITATQYEANNASLQYLLAVTYNKLGKTDEAIAAATKSIELEEDANEKRAAAYFELGTAYNAKGDNVQACAAFKKALFGPNAEAAKYQIEQELKCN